MAALISTYKKRFILKSVYKHWKGLAKVRCGYVKYVELQAKSRLDSQ